MLRTGFVFFSLAAVLLGQIDAGGFATSLRARYGPPLDRQTFEPRPGIEMIVDYAPSGHVCRIQLPAIAPEQDRPNVSSKRGLEQFLTDLLPTNLRGKELRRMSEQLGAMSLSLIEYENVTIGEMSQPDRHGTVTVDFRGESCRVG